MHSSDKPMWTIQQALEFCRDATYFLNEVGFAAGLTGGIIIRNERSDHDIDLIVYPLQSPKGDIADAKSALEKLGMKQVYSRESLTERWRSKGSLDEKWVEVWDFEGKRVDLFFLR